MKFERIVSLKKVLEFLYENVSLKNDINNKISLFNSLMSDAEFQCGEFLTLLNEIDDKNSTILVNLKKLIDALEQTAVTDGLALLNDTTYIAKFSQESTNNIKLGNINTEELIKITMAKYVTWQHPALYLNSEITVDRIDYLVAGDPLYLAGSSMDKLSAWAKKYPEIYQRRIRLYDIVNDDFSQLPQNQFGFVFCWEFFNSLSSDYIETHLKYIISLLKPGGVLMFSYNNADLDITARLVDQGFLPWASKQYIEQLLSTVGYEIIKFVDIQLTDVDDTYVSWVEVKKPGKLTTIKRSQVMGEIKQK